MIGSRTTSWIQYAMCILTKQVKLSDKWTLPSRFKKQVSDGGVMYFKGFEERCSGKGNKFW